MTTDETILALVERHGFVLPEGLVFDSLDKGKLSHQWMYGGRLIPESKRIQMMHDLCACEFTRQVCNRDTPADNEWMEHHMGYGETAAAIRALYEAMELK